MLPGGTHAEGATHNALVSFADGSYLELIAFLDHRIAHRWAAPARQGLEGFIDYALLPGSVPEVVAAARARGLDYQGPFDGGRTRPDGERLIWQTGLPPSRDLPFLCGEVSNRALRVPAGAAHMHANGAPEGAALRLQLEQRGEGLIGLALQTTSAQARQLPRTRAHGAAISLQAG